MWDGATGALLERPDGFDDHEGVALARGPDVLAESLPRRRVAARASRCVDERERVFPIQWRKRQLHETLLVLKILQSLPHHRGLGELLRSRGDRDQHARAVQVASYVAEQSHAGVVGPVHVLEEDHERASHGECFDEPADRFEESRAVVGV